MGVWRGDEQLTVGQQHVFALMALVERKYRKEMKAQLAMVRQTAREHELLSLINEGRFRTPGSLARASGVSRQLLHRVLRRLEADGLIQRWVHGVETKVGLTRRGEEVLEETDEFVLAFRNSVLARFGLQQQEALKGLLLSLDSVLDAARRRPEYLES